MPARSNPSIARAFVYVFATIICGACGKSTPPAAVSAKPSSSPVALITDPEPIAPHPSSSASQPPPRPAIDAAPAEVRNWLGAPPAGTETAFPTRGYLFLLPPGASFAPPPPGHAGWMVLSTGSGRSAMKLRRTATNYDPTATFDPFPACPKVDDVRAAIRTRITIDREWFVPSQPHACQMTVGMLAFEDKGAFGFYIRIGYHDPEDKVSNESELVTCCAADVPNDDIGSMATGLTESGAREHASACLSLHGGGC